MSATNNSDSQAEINTKILDDRIDKALERRAALGGSDGNGHGGGNDRRITRLEVLAEEAAKRSDRVEGRIDRVDSKLDQVLALLVKLPTKWELFGYTATVLSIAVAIVAVIVTGIIGGLGWIRPEQPPPPTAMAPAPTPPSVIYVVPQQAPAAPAPVPQQ